MTSELRPPESGNGAAPDPLGPPAPRAGLGELAAALAAAQAEFTPVKKSRTAQLEAYAYSYATLADARAATTPALARHGLALVQTFEMREGVLYLATRLLHVSGQELRSDLPIPMGKDLRPQQLGSLLTYLRRYALMALLWLAGEDDDDDGASAEASPAATPATKRRARSSAPSSGAPPPSSSGAKRISEDQVRRLWSIAADVATRLELPREPIERWIRAWLEDLQLASTKDLSPQAYDRLCEKLLALELDDLARVKRQAAAKTSAPEDPPPPTEEPPCPF